MLFPGALLGKILINIFLTAKYPHFELVVLFLHQVYKSY